VTYPEVVNTCQRHDGCRRKRTFGTVPEDSCA
jgi:hypothetical protein